MCSEQIAIDKACYVDPGSDCVVSYAQFVADLALQKPTTQHPDADELQTGVAGTDGSPECEFEKRPNQYRLICQLVANIVRGNDFCLGNNRVRTTRKNGDNQDQDQVDWLAAIRNSASQIRLETSGTTGSPKQVVHSIKTLTRGVKTGEQHKNDVWGLAYPLDHLAGLQVLFQALLNQNTIVQLFGLSTELVHQAIDQRQITHLSCTPTFLKLLAADDHTHPGVKRLTTGGERFDAETMASVDRLFPAAKHRNIYALTEVGNLLIAEGDRFRVPAELEEKVTVIDGNLAIHHSLLADPTIATVARAPAGSIQVLDETNRESDSRWYVTGDLVEILDDKPLTFKFSARRDDLINVGGYKVIPQQVEEHLAKIPSIRQAVVYGKKNSVTGQIVVCDVVTESGLQFDPVSAKKELAETLPRYAVPRIFNIVESLRMTPTGKLCRRDEES